MRNRINESRVGRASSIEVDPGSEEWEAPEAAVPVAAEVLRMLTATTVRQDAGGLATRHWRCRLKHAAAEGDRPAGRRSGGQGEVRNGAVRCGFGDVEGLQQERHAPPAEDQTVAWHRPCAKPQVLSSLRLCSLARSIPFGPPQEPAAHGKASQAKK